MWREKGEYVTWEVTHLLQNGFSSILWDVKDELCRIKRVFAKLCNMKRESLPKS